VYVSISCYPLIKKANTAKYLNWLWCVCVVFMFC